MLGQDFVPLFPQAEKNESEEEASHNSSGEGDEEDNDRDLKHELITQEALKRRKPTNGDKLKQDPKTRGQNLKRNRKNTILELNIQNEEELLVSENLNKRAAVSSSSTTSGSDAKESPETSARQEKEQFSRREAPVGVTIIGDDEEVVLSGVKKVLQQGRYFDPEGFEPNSQLCWNCGGRGHLSRECTEERKEKPCPLCGELGHMEFTCPAVRGIFSWNSSSQRGVGTSKYSLPLICVRCGHPDCLASGKPDFSRAEGNCSMDYSRKDLELIRCRACGQKGHLNCKEDTLETAQPSCYECGEQGHLGMHCPRRSSSAALSRERREWGNAAGMVQARSPPYEPISYSSPREAYRPSRKSEPLPSRHTYWGDTMEDDSRRPTRFRYEEAGLVARDTSYAAVGLGQATMPTGSLAGQPMERLGGQLYSNQQPPAATYFQQPPPLLHHQQHQQMHFAAPSPQVQEPSFRTLSGGYMPHQY